MSDFTIAKSDLMRVCAWGGSKADKLLATPFRLPFEKAPSGCKGGGRVRYHRLADLLPRARDRGMTDEQAAQFALLDHERRKDSK